MITYQFSSRHRGFSLVELSVVIVIIGMILGMVVSSFSAFVKNSAQAATREKQVAIKDTLISYLRANGRLPCPDIGPRMSTGISTTSKPDGIENRTGDTATVTDTVTNCTSTVATIAVGVVPYATLGLPRETVVDAWGNYFTYVVSNNQTPVPVALLLSNPPRDWVKSATFRTGNLGDIEVLDDFSSSLNAVALLISHGPNGAGAWTTKGSSIDSTGAGDNEANYNASGCPRFAASGLRRCYKREFTDNSSATGGAFDDVVYVVTPDVLLAPLYVQSAKDSPQADFRNQCSAIRDALVLAGLAARTISPVAYTVTYSPTLTDPYSTTPLICSYSAAVQMSTPASTDPVCSFVSKGPDGLSGTPDDLTCNITVGDLRSVFAKTGF